MPIRKVGSETPSSDSVITSCEPKRPRRSAAYTPSGTPTASAITAAARASSSVAGKRSAISDDTLRPWRRLRPNSPCTALPTKRANCTGKGSSSPRSWRNWSRCSCVASWPSRLVTGSPTYWNSMKAMKATVSITMTACSRRRRMKASMGRAGSCGVHVLKRKSRPKAAPEILRRASLEARPCQGQNEWRTPNS